MKKEKKGPTFGGESQCRKEPIASNVKAWGKAQMSLHPLHYSSNPYFHLPFIKSIFYRHYQLAKMKTFLDQSSGMRDSITYMNANIAVEMLSY